MLHTMNSNHSNEGLGTKSMRITQRLTGPKPKGKEGKASREPQKQRHTDHDLNPKADRPCLLLQD